MHLAKAHLRPGVRLLHAAWLVVPAVFIVLAGAARQAVINTEPHRDPAWDETPSSYGLPYEEVWFATEDGLVLSGWWIPSTNGAAVVFTHGLGQDRVDLLARAAPLAERGYGALLYDLRGHGLSDGARFQTSWASHEDVTAALAFVLGRAEVDPDKVGAFGFSVGASSTIRAAAAAPEISALFLDGTSSASFTDEPWPDGPGDWLLFPGSLAYYPLLSIQLGIPEPTPQIELLDDLAPRPLFFVSAGRAIEARQTARYFDRASSPKELWNIPEAGHGGGMRARPVEYASALTTFFDRALLGEGSGVPCAW